MSFQDSSVSLFSGQDPHSREAVILFHGLTGTPSEIEELAQAVYSKGFDCLAPCLSGHSSTIADLSQVSLARWLEDAQEALDRMTDYSGVHVIGQSFGALLAIYLALRFPHRVRSAVGLSLPWRFRSCVRENILSVAARLPDPLLNTLGFVDKQEREGVHFREKREAYTQHSISAAVRLFQLRRLLRDELPMLKTPTLLLHDPLDHHLDPSAVWQFRRDAGVDANISSAWLPGGYHELTLGPCYEKVQTAVLAFIVEHASNAS